MSTPYRQWCENVVHELEKYGICDGLLLDLGCGTGTMTELLAARGFDMIGLDCSEEMLNIAFDKRAQSGQDILYLNQDMRCFELYGTVRAVGECVRQPELSAGRGRFGVVFSSGQQLSGPSGDFFSLILTPDTSMRR